MTIRDAWLEVFPVERTQEAVEFLVRTWEKVSRAHKDEYAFRRRENMLTESLWMDLMKFQGESRLTGKWTYEDPQARRIDNGKVKRIRKDITYFSDRHDIHLIFEFKKIKLGDLRSYYGIDGMRRFADGDYAIKMEFALMMGMIQGERGETIKAIKKAIDKPVIRAGLSMIYDKEKGFIRMPSTILPKIADFETEHQRPEEFAPPKGSTTLAHIFIEIS